MLTVEELAKHDERMHHALWLAGRALEGEFEQVNLKDVECLRLKVKLAAGYLAGGYFKDGEN